MKKGLGRSPSPADVNVMIAAGGGVRCGCPQDPLARTDSPSPRRVSLAPLAFARLHYVAHVDLDP